MEYRVIAHSGCSYANVPVEFFIGEERHLVARVVATWLEESEGMEGMTRQVWRVLDQDETSYRLTYHLVADSWEIDAARGNP